MDARTKYHRGLRAISPLEGREILFTEDLEAFLSEGALHRYRGVVEVENLIALSESDLAQRPTITDSEKERLRKLVSIGEFDSNVVADYDHFGREGKGPFEHDVKSVEVYLRERLVAERLGRLNEFVHFPMTSEDVNNIAYNLMVRDAINHVWMPRILEVSDRLAELSERHANTPVLGKTHGMNASPTTIGKRFAYTLDKITSALSTLRDQRLTAKFSGPVGNHNAMVAVAPDFDMESYVRRFVSQFGFDYSPVENQRISHQAMINVLNQVQMVNLIGADLAENVRHGVMMKWLYLEGNKSHVGSSVMPHKINPWLFEVGQGYLEISDALIDGSRKGLIASVFERDLTDHPWERMYGEMIGHSVVGLGYLGQGLPMLRVDQERCVRDLEDSPEILSEAVQIAGRLSGSEDIYMKIKEATRGKGIGLQDLRRIAQTEISDPILRERFLSLTTANYTGKAADLARQAVSEYKSLKPSISKGVLGVAKNG